MMHVPHSVKNSEVLQSSWWFVLSAGLLPEKLRHVMKLEPFTVKQEAQRFMFLALAVTS